MSQSNRPEFARCDCCQEIRVCCRARKPKREGDQIKYIIVWLCHICLGVEVIR